MLKYIIPLLLIAPPVALSQPFSPTVPSLDIGGTYDFNTSGNNLILTGPSNGVLILDFQILSHASDSWAILSSGDALFQGITLQTLTLEGLTSPTITVADGFGTIQTSHNLRVGSDGVLIDATNKLVSASTFQLAAGGSILLGGGYSIAETGSANLGGVAVTGLDFSGLFGFSTPGGNLQLAGGGDFILNLGELAHSANTWSIAASGAATFTEVTRTNEPVVFIVSCSDETSDLASGTALATFRAPYAFTISEVRASLSEAANGTDLVTVDINEGGTTIMAATKLTIDPTEKTSTTAATQPVVSDSTIAADAEITIDLDQVGDVTPGKGLKVTILGTMSTP